MVRDQLSAEAEQSLDLLISSAVNRLHVEVYRVFRSLAVWHLKEEHLRMVVVARYQAGLRIEGHVILGTPITQHFCPKAG